MQILEDLYLGDVRPGERSGSRNRQHVKALDELLKAEEELSASLSKAQKKLFENFTDAQREVSILTDAETLSYSFKVKDGGSMSSRRRLQTSPCKPGRICTIVRKNRENASSAPASARSGPGRCRPVR